MRAHRRLLIGVLIGLVLLICCGCSLFGKNTIVPEIEEDISAEITEEEAIAQGDEYLEELMNSMATDDKAMYTEDDLYYAERLSNARDIIDGDLGSPKAYIPAELYTYGINYGLFPNEGNSKYLNNADTLAAMSEEELSDFLACVSGFISNYYTFDYRNGSTTIEENLSYYLSPNYSSKTALNPEIRQNINNQLITDCKFLTDKSLIYTDDAGYYRVRGRLFTYIQFVSSSATSQSDYNMAPGKWYYYDIELAFVKDTAPGIWDHANYCFALYYNMTNTRELSYEEIEQYLQQ